MASVSCQDSALGLSAATIPANGVLMRNLLHGADTVMSHITHLYHLSALDFINTSAYPGMAPWIPCYTGDGLASLNGATGTGAVLVANYVEALEIRRKCHAAGALFNAKHPCGSSPVAGGITDIATTDKMIKFAKLMDEVRNFTNTKYIPNVLTVAGAYSAYWTVGRGCQNLLSYGDFPEPSTGSLLLKRGRVDGAATLRSVDQTAIREYVGHSFYSDATTGQHPSIGATEPDTLKMLDTTGTYYSWLKAPRYLATGGEVGRINGAGTTWTSGQPVPHEVGPLARVLATHLGGTSTQKVVSQAANSLSGVTVGTGFGFTNATYNLSDLVTHATPLIACRLQIFSALSEGILLARLRPNT